LRTESLLSAQKYPDKFPEDFLKKPLGSLRLSGPEYAEYPVIFPVSRGFGPRRPVSLDCIRHHPVLPNRVFFCQVQIAVCAGISAIGSALYRLCGSSLSPAAILAALSPHPEIPFLAA
jgi:hypothetical protein